MLLIQIVPSIAPKVDGIGDHGLELARRLREEHGIQSAFLVCDLSWEGGPIEGFPALRLNDRTEETFERAIAELQHRVQDVGPPEVLLHFSPYGYEKRGCPFWLVRLLERWNARNPDRLHIGFHELENHNRNPLSSTFWLSGVQRALVTRVCKLGRYKYSNTEPHRHKLEMRGSGRIFWAPSFSTLGEASTYPGWDQRNPRIVVFGRGVQRKEAYGRGGEALRFLCNALQIRTIVDIGERINIDSKAFPGMTIETTGRLPPAAVVDLMIHSLGSFISYPVPLLTKSSIYAVSCAYGAVPFVHDPLSVDFSCTGIMPNRDYVPLQRHDSIFPNIALEEISRTAFANYKRRNSKFAAALAGAQIFHVPTML